MPVAPDARLAVLIDADNAQASKVDALLTEIAKYGVATVKRAYGDWTGTHLTKWKDVLHVHAIQPMQQFSYTTGKNATDSAMIIDAMDLLYSGRLEGFCLVTSDSDFTRLASRLRESGSLVYGFGDRKTPKSLVAACDRFIYLDVLTAPTDEADSSQTRTTRKTGAELRGDAKLVNWLRAGVEAASDDEGWAHLGGVGSNVAKQAPDFDPRSWGYAKLVDLATAIDLFEVKRQGPTVLLRSKPATKSPAKKAARKTAKKATGTSAQ